MRGAGTRVWGRQRALDRRLAVFSHRWPPLKNFSWEDTMKFNALAAGLLAATFLTGAAANAAQLGMVSGSTGGDLKWLRTELDKFEAKTGDKVTLVPMPSSTSDQFSQYRLWLAAGNPDIDVYMTDVIWAPQLAEQFVDLTAASKDVIKSHFPSIVESQTANGKLV